MGRIDGSLLQRCERQRLAGKEVCAFALHEANRHLQDFEHAQPGRAGQRVAVQHTQLFK